MRSVNDTDTLYVYVDPLHFKTGEVLYPVFHRRDQVVCHCSDIYSVRYDDMEINDQFVPGIHRDTDPFCHTLSLEKIEKAFLAVQGSHTNNPEALVSHIACVLCDHFRIDTDISNMCI